MKPEQATALRKPFPPEAVGRLPKAGVHLDYVGHAAVTDRLLSIDPEWSWEPMALDPAGLPAPDVQGNLWIKLTICGVTRIGVGDGKSAKERIGDAIRNAAMRFGVALDLWSKEELEQAHGPAAAPAATPPPVNDAPITTKTRGEMFALFGKKGIGEDAQLAGINQITGKQYASRGDVTEADAKEVIAMLKQRPDAIAATDAD